MVWCELKWHGMVRHDMAKMERKSVGVRILVNQQPPPPSRGRYCGGSMCWQHTLLHCTQHRIVAAPTAYGSNELATGTLWCDLVGGLPSGYTPPLPQLHLCLKSTFVSAPPLSQHHPHLNSTNSTLDSALTANYIIHLLITLSHCHSSYNGTSTHIHSIFSQFVGVYPTPKPQFLQG